MMFFRDKITTCFAFIGLVALIASVFAGTHTAHADTPVFFVHINAGDEGVLEDGQIVHLQGVRAPVAGSGVLSEQSAALLQALTDHVPLILNNPVKDRYGRLTAQIYLMPPKGKKTWLQQEMLRQGMVFVYPPTGKEGRVDDMIEAETEAYSQHLGLWSDPTYADTPASQAQDLYGHFAFITGKVVKAERVKNMVYLEFGVDWRTHFTVEIMAHDLKTFRKAGIEPFAYQGSMVRVRGWVKRDYGPIMMVTTPYQIQILEQH